MKRMSKILLIIALVALHVQVVSAASKVWVDENFNLSSIRRLLISEPNYSPAKDGATTDEVMGMFYQEGTLSNLYVLQKTDIEKNILRDSSINLATLAPDKAKETFDAQVPKYTDGYLVATVIHNSRVVIFFDVYSAATKEMVFSYQTIAGSKDDDNIATYKRLTKNFYKEFEKKIKSKK